MAKIFGKNSKNTTRRAIDICYLENISGAEQPQTCTIEDELNIDGSMEVSMF